MFFLNGMLNRLDNMIQRAIEGKNIEMHYDESKLSKIESKLYRFIKIHQAEKFKLKKEHRQIHSLIADISHQTKTPITNLKLYIDILEETSLNDDQTKQVVAIKDQADRLQFLIDALVLGARLESGVIKVTPIKQPVHLLISQVIGQLNTNVIAHNITIRYQKTEASATFDIKWTSEALLNIVDNAIKYTEDGGYIDIEVQILDLFCCITISDTGIGFDECAINDLFKRFYRGKNALSYSGIGIGLYLSREIIAKQSGYITAQNNSTNGSCFKVYLPSGK